MPDTYGPATISLADRLNVFPRTARALEKRGLVSPFNESSVQAARRIFRDYEVRHGRIRDTGTAIILLTKYLRAEDRP